MNSLKNPMNLSAITLPLAVVILLFVSLSKEAAQAWDLSWGMNLIVQIALLGFLFLSLYFAKKFSKHLLSQKPRLSHLSWVLLLALFATQTIHREVPALHRVQSDEVITMSMAQNILAQGAGGSCDMGYFDQEGQLDCLATANTFKTKLQANIYTWALFFTPNPTQFGFQLHLVLYFLSILAMWSGIWLWSRSYLLAGASTAFMAFTPMIMIQFRSLSVEPYHVFFSLVALNILHFARAQGPQTLLKWLWLSFTLGLFAQTRQESAVAALAFIIPSLPYLVKRPKVFLTLTSTLTILVLPILGTILAYRGFDFQGGQHQAHGFNNFIEHLSILWEQMTIPEKDERLITPFLGVTTYLSLIGLGLLILSAIWRPQFDQSSKRFARLSLLFMGVFLLQAYVILENVSGDMTIKINQRYLLVILPTMAFCIGYLFKELFNTLPRILFKNQAFPKPQLAIWSLTVLVSILAFSLTYMHRNSFRENIMYKGLHLPEEQRQLHQWMGQSQERSLFIYTHPWHFVGIGQSSIGPTVWSRLSLSKREALLKEYQGRVYYVRGLKCWDRKSYHSKVKETRIPQVCNQFEKTHALKLLHQVKVLNSYDLKVFQVLAHNQKSAPSTNHTTLAPGPQTKIVFLRSDSASFELSEPVREPLTLRVNGKAIHRFEFSQEKAGLGKIQAPLGGLKPGLHEISLSMESRGRLRFLLREYQYLRSPNTHALTPNLLKDVKQDWGSLQVNKSVLGQPLKIAGRPYPQGYGTHANSTLVFALPPGYQTLHALIGMDDDEICGDGAQFEVLATGRSLYRSPQLTAGKAIPIQVKLPPTTELTFKTHAGANNHCDHTDWVWTTLEK